MFTASHIRSHYVECCSLFISSSCRSVCRREIMRLQIQMAMVLQVPLQKGTLSKPKVIFCSIFILWQHRLVLFTPHSHEPVQEVLGLDQWYSISDCERRLVLDTARQKTPIKHRCPRPRGSFAFQQRR